MDPTTDYFTKELYFHRGNGFVNLYKHFPKPLPGSRPFRWEVAVNDLFVTQKKDQSKRLPIIGIPISLSCSHSSYTFETEWSGAETAYNSLGLYDVENLLPTKKRPKPGKKFHSVIIEGNHFSYPKKFWVPFNADQGDIVKFWFQYPECILARQQYLNFTKYSELIRRTEIFAWVAFRRKVECEQSCLTMPPTFYRSKQQDAQSEAASCFMVSTDQFDNLQQVHDYLQQICLNETELSSLKSKQLKMHQKEVKQLYDRVKKYKQKVCNYDNH